MRARVWVAAGAVVVTAGFGVGATAAVWENHKTAELSTYWQLQTHEDCVEMAAAVVVADRTGHLPTEAQVTDVAARVTDYTPQGGTTWEEIPTLLAAYGVTSFETVGIDMRSLTAVVDSGADVIVPVQSGIVWAAEGLTGQGQGRPGDHAIVVERINNAGVTVVDSAWPGGRGAVIPTAVFEKAWTSIGATYALIAPEEKQ